MLAHYLRSLVLIHACVWAFLFENTQAQSAFIPNDEHQSVLFTPKISLLLDPSAELNLEQVLSTDYQSLFTEASAQVPNFGYTDAAIWCKLEVRSEADFPMYLQVNYAPIDHIDLYIANLESADAPERYTHQGGGELLNFSQKYYHHNLFLFPVSSREVSPQIYQIYLRIKSSKSLQVPIMVGSWQGITEYNHRRDYAHGMYFGFLMVTFLYNLFVYFSVRDRSYLYYIAYIFWLGLSIAGVTGYSFEWLWPEQAWLNYLMPAITTNLAGAFGALFAVTFLQAREYSPRWFQVFRLFPTLFLSFVLLSCLGFPAWGFQLGQGLIFLLCIYTYILAIHAIHKGFRPAILYILAFSVFFLGSGIYILKDYNLLPYSFYTQNTLLLGSAIEVFLFSLALADKINFYKNEQERAKEEKLKALKENERLITEQNIRLEEKVEERTQELQESNEELNITLQQLRDQHQVIETKNKDITSSLNYAFRIQTAMLPRAERIKTCLPDHFIFFKPRDIVSGDFYWFHEETDENDCQKMIIAAIDCTGHGIPGAFMSMIADSLLNYIVLEKNIKKANLILNEMHRSVYKALQQDVSENKDGMDVSLCVIDQANQTLEFAGAHHPLVYIQDQQLHYIKGDRSSIGGYPFEKEQRFSCHQIKLDRPTAFYLFSDGFPDQFGGPKIKKYMIRRFRNFLLRIHQRPMEEQKTLLENELITWMGTTEKQIDDILVMGVSLD